MTVKAEVGRLIRRRNGCPNYWPHEQPHLQPPRPRTPKIGPEGCLRRVMRPLQRPQPHGHAEMAGVMVVAASASASPATWQRCQLEPRQRPVAAETA